jgi:hypothetical protein
MLMLGNDANDSIMFEGSLATISGPMMTDLFGKVRTTGDVVDLGNTMVMGKSTVDTTGNDMNPDGAKITFHEPLNAKDDSKELTLTAGMMGDITFMDKVGAGAMARLGPLEITMAHNVTAMDKVDARSLVQGDGTGMTMLMDDVTTIDKVMLKNNAFVLHGTEADMLKIHSDGKVELDSTKEQWVVDPDPNSSAPRQLDHAIISTAKGSISHEILILSSKDKAYAALDNSMNMGLPILGGRGTGEINVEITDSKGNNIEITIDWREGVPTPAMKDPPVHNPPNTDRAREVTASLPLSPPELNPAEFTHLYETPVQTLPGNLVPVFVNISDFAQGNIVLKSAAESILIVDKPPMDGLIVERVIGGMPNGIQVTILVPVITVQGSASAIPQPEPLSTPIILPTVMTTAETPAPQPVEAATFEVQASAGTTGETAKRYYELRIVSFEQDDEGKINESESVPINLDDLNKQVDPDDEVAREVLPFDPSKLRELFRRLPDDRYRLYLIEDGVERLLLDFVIEQGRPVEMEIEAAEPEEIGEATDQNQGPGEQLGDPFEAGEEGAFLRPQHPVVPSVMPSEEPTFADRLAAAPFISHGGVLITAAAWTRATSARRNDGAPQRNSSDRLMAQFARHRGSLKSGRSVQSKSGHHPQPVINHS